MQAYITGTQEKAKRLQWALGISLLAAFVVSAALVATSVGKRVPKGFFDVFYHKGEKQDSVSIRGNFPTKKEISICVEPKESKEREVEIYRTIATPSGEVTVTMPIAKHRKEYWISVEWHDDQGYIRSISKEVGPGKTQK